MLNLFSNTPAIQVTWLVRTLWLADQRPAPNWPHWDEWVITGRISCNTDWGSAGSWNTSFSWDQSFTDMDRSFYDSAPKVMPAMSPRIPHRHRVNGSTSLPRQTPAAKEARKQYRQQLHAENERLCDSVAETYMVGRVLFQPDSDKSIKSLFRHWAMFFMNW